MAEGQPRAPSAALGVGPASGPGPSRAVSERAVDLDRSEQAQVERDHARVRAALGRRRPPTTLVPPPKGTTATPASAQAASSGLDPARRSCGHQDGVGRARQRAPAQPDQVGIAAPGGVADARPRASVRTPPSPAARGTASGSGARLGQLGTASSATGSRGVAGLDAELARAAARPRRSGSSGGGPRRPSPTTWSAPRRRSSRVSRLPPPLRPRRGRGPRAPREGTAGGPPHHQRAEAGEALEGAARWPASPRSRRRPASAGSRCVALRRIPSNGVSVELLLEDVALGVGSADAAVVGPHPAPVAGLEHLGPAPALAARRR